MHTDLRTEYWACLALRHCNGIGPKTWKRMLERYGSAYEAVRSVDQWEEHKTGSARMAASYRSDEWREGARREWNTVLGAGWEILPWSDDRYPQLLREIANPPVVLYALGDVSLLSAVSVGIVGPRRCTRIGVRVTMHISAGLSRAGITVASGMAWGIDREAHMAALDGVGRSIGVLGTGLDLIYPAGNRDLWVRMAASGLLITEFAPGTPPLPHNFPQRNRIIAGISRGVVVAEAPEKSGGLITARHALESDREVFVVAGPDNNPAFAGCAALVEQGARSVESASEIIEEMAPLLRAVGREESVFKSMGARRFGAPPTWAMAAAARRVAQGLAKGGDEKSSLPPEPQDTTQPPEQSAGPDRSGIGDDETKVLEVLDALESPDSNAPRIHIDELGRKLDWTPQRVSGALLLLEMRGLVCKHPGMVYSAA